MVRFNSSTLLKLPHSGLAKSARGLKARKRSDELRNHSSMNQIHVRGGYSLVCSSEYRHIRKTKIAFKIEYRKPLERPPASTKTRRDDVVESEMDRREEERMEVEEGDATPAKGIMAQPPNDN
ncbi:hypothetical protein HZH68_016588 [Vespula germanica]|uniref:Uncharacterized protein n=1 Tax=Vespula germanica TaxID=30212 RepID=A0A834MNX6_VESGE|nr:hypothetical protein HZH68_016588 [Vespula germanica]